jgi:hypothetical protein
MFDATPDETGGPTPTPPPADPRIETAERHLQMLRHLTAWGMDAAQACAGLVTASGWRSKAVICDEANVWSSETAKQIAMRGQRDAADAFHFITRAVRLTMALETATAERLSDLRAGVAERRDKARDAESPAVTEEAAEASDANVDGPMGIYRETVNALVTEAIAAEVGDESVAREMRAELRERLTECDRFGPLMLKPLREVVAKICDDIGLAPDWSRWEGEGWSVDYVPPRGPDWPLPWKPRRARIRQALAHAIASIPAPPHPPEPVPPAPYPRQ